jgi:hypothetical protein
VEAIKHAARHSSRFISKFGQAQILPALAIPKDRLLQHCGWSQQGSLTGFVWRKAILIFEPEFMTWINSIML